MKLLRKLTQGKSGKYSRAYKTGYPVLFFYLEDITSTWKGLCFIHRGKRHA